MAHVSVVCKPVKTGEEPTMLSSVSVMNNCFSFFQDDFLKKICNATNLPTFHSDYLHTSSSFCFHSGFDNKIRLCSYMGYWPLSVKSWSCTHPNLPAYLHNRVCKRYFMYFIFRHLLDSIKDYKRNKLDWNWFFYKFHFILFYLFIYFFDVVCGILYLII